MSSSTGFYTSIVPVQSDWYFHLRQRISTLRALSKPAKPDDPDQIPSFQTCNKGRLLQYISFIHTSIVSLFVFRFPFNSFIFIQKEHADRDPDFLSDPLVIRFLSTLFPMVLRLDEDAVPDTWSLWFDRQAAEAHTEVCMFYRSTNSWFSQFHQADDRFEWLDVFPYRKGDDIVEQKNVFFLPLSQPLHGKDPRPVVTPSTSTSSLKRPRPCKLPVIFLSSLL